MKLIQRLAFRCLMLSGLVVLLCGDAFCQDSSLLRVSNPGTRVPVTLPAMQGKGGHAVDCPRGCTTRQFSNEGGRNWATPHATGERHAGPSASRTRSG